MSKKQEKTKILVVDDEKIITMHLEELLPNMGYNVVGTASTGIEAIRKARKLNPDLVLMDIIMPGEMNGIDAAKEIKDELDIPIIFLTAFADDKIVEKAKTSEPFSYIVKPFQGQELKAAIEIAVYKKEMERRLSESEKKYRTLVEESKDGVGIIQDGVFKYVNPALFDMLGKPQDINQTGFQNYFDGESRIGVEEAYCRRMEGEENPSINEFVLSRKDGSYLPVETSTTLINYEGKPAILSIFHSLAERRQMEQMLDYLVREINGCNQIVISNIEKLITSTTDNKQKKRLENILPLLFNNANTIKKAYKLLQVEHKNSELFHVDPLEKINEAAMIVTNQFPEKDLQINIRINGLTSNILADEFIEDVFCMLFENSLECTENDSVNIDVYIGADSVKKPKYVEIKVEEHNCCIPDEEKKKIFNDLAINEKNNGMGLNLSIMKSVLDRYSGEIRLEDRVKGDHTKGCAFVLRIPTTKCVG